MLCPYCPHHCVLEESGAPGRCRARAKRGGRNIPLNHGQISSLALDPIEKKPLYHFHPGTYILSVGSFGCNMDCFFCQNDSISCAGEGEVPCEDLAPEALVQLAVRTQPQGSIGVAFTYNEPLIGWEYVRDCARLLKAEGLKTVVVTNGCFRTGPLEGLFPLVDAFNIDLKGFSASWYQRLGGDLPTVQQFIQRAVMSSHVELTTLVVPGENDSEAEMETLAAWVSSLSPAIPLHISRFFPRRDARGMQPTPPQTVRRLCDVARRRLEHVHIGNL